MKRSVTPCPNIGASKKAFMPADHTSNLNQIELSLFSNRTIVSSPFLIRSKYVCSRLIVELAWKIKMANKVEEEMINRLILNLLDR